MENLDDKVLTKELTSFYIKKILINKMRMDIKNILLIKI